MMRSFLDILKEQVSRTVYHVTLTRNLNRIQQEGLVPKIGTRSRRLGEKVPAVFCFPSRESLAGAEWLFDQFGETTKLSLLQIELPVNARTQSDVEYELAVLDPIPPTAITVLDRDYQGEI